VIFIENGPVPKEPAVVTEGSDPVVVVTLVLYPKPTSVAFGATAVMLPLNVAVVGVTAVAETVVTAGGTVTTVHGSVVNESIVP